MLQMTFSQEFLPDIFEQQEAAFVAALAANKPTCPDCGSPAEIHGATTEQDRSASCVSVVAICTQDPMNHAPSQYRQFIMNLEERCNK